MKDKEIGRNLQALQFLKSMQPEAEDPIKQMQALATLELTGQRIKELQNKETPGEKRDKELDLYAQKLGMATTAYMDRLKGRWDFIQAHPKPITPSFTEAMAKLAQAIGNKPSFWLKKGEYATPEEAAATIKLVKEGHVTPTDFNDLFRMDDPRVLRMLIQAYDRPQEATYEGFLAASGITLPGDMQAPTQQSGPFPETPVEGEEEPDMSDIESYIP